MINFSKTFLQIQPFFIVWNQKKNYFHLSKNRIAEKRLLNLKWCSKIFTQDTKAISNLIYLLQHCIIYLNSTLWYQLIGTKRNPWVTVYLQSPTSYSHNTSTLLLSFQLCYRPLGIFQTVNKKRYTYWIKLLLNIFNSSVKKHSNLESSLLITETSWKKTLKISTQTFRMVTNLSKIFLTLNHFSLLEIKSKCFLP